MRKIIFTREINTTTMLRISEEEVRKLFRLPVRNGKVIETSWDSYGLHIKFQNQQHREDKIR